MKRQHRWLGFASLSLALPYFYQNLFQFGNNGGNHGSFQYEEKKQQDHHHHCRHDHDEKEKHEPSQEENTFWSEFAICRSANLTTPRHIDIADPLLTTLPTELPVFYPCAGPRYDTFTKQLVRFARNMTTTNNSNSNSNNNKTRPHHWGRRKPFILPPQSRILVWGNSHVRQVAHALVCQQASSSSSSSSSHTKTSSSSSLIQVTRLQGNAIMQYDFAHNTSMIVVSGSPMAYRREWRHELQQLLGIQDLNSSMDAVILGHVEPCHGGYVSRQQQQQAVVQNNGTTQQQQDHDACHAYPTITEWTQVYAGPIVFVSGFSNHFDRQALAVRHEMGRVVAKQPQRTNLAWLWGRQYMTRYDLDECAASGGKVTVADCHNNSIRNGQRCTGANGGHADVLAWDVSEFLHYYLMERDNDDKEQTGVEYFRVPVDPRLQHVHEDEHLVHDDFVWCPANQHLQVPGLEVDIVRIFYQCQGPLYDQYTQDLRHKLFTDTIKSQTTASWGKRHFALPHHARILVWGNSHTRQVLKALACQQNTVGHLVGIEPLDNIYGGIMYYFSNNATIVSLCNSVAPYSRNWLQFLELGLSMKLNEFDAVVLGFFNYCRGSNRVKIEAAAGNNSDIDCSPSNPPPTVVDIAQVYKGPIVFTTMFDSSRYRDTPDYLQQVQELRKKGRSNVYAVHARQYAQDWGIECLSPSRETVHDCGERVIVGNNTEALSTGHACMGPAGGTADLVAWDVAELLFEQLS